MLILVTIMFLLPLGLLTLHLYLSGVFTNRRAFQFTFFYPVGLLCADHRDRRQSTFLPRLQPPVHNPGVAECDSARTLGRSAKKVARRWSLGTDQDE